MKIQFNSPELRSVYEESKNILDRIVNYRDMISDDIRNLESLLKECHLGDAIYYCVDQVQDDFDRDIIRSDNIAWDPKKKRLMFVKIEQTLIDYEPVTFNPPHTLSEKPLIELPFDLRKKFHKLLPKFLSHIVKDYIV